VKKGNIKVSVPRANANLGKNIDEKKNENRLNEKVFHKVSGKIILN
jgi:hypothetical protein